MRNPILLLATVVQLATGAAIAYAQEAGDVRAGHAVAQNVCSVCHAVGKGQARSPNANAPTFVKIATVPGMTTAALLAALQTSHRERTMPNLILPPDELRDVTAYILSLK